MQTPNKLIAAALFASTLPLLGATAGAAPMSQSLTVQPGNATPAQTVQFRARGPHHRGGWAGPGLAFGTGLALGAFAAAPYAYSYEYEPYAYAPGAYPAVPAPAIPGRTCRGVTDDMASINPAWACDRPSNQALDW